MVNDCRPPQLPEPIPTVSDLFRIREPRDEAEGMFALDRNERLASWPDWFIDEVRASLSEKVLHRYPVQGPLIDALVGSLGIPEESLLITAGSDAGLKSVYHAYVRAGDGVVMLNPSYAMYPVYAGLFGARVTRVPFADDLRLDMDQLRGSIEADVRLVLLANPNQPTGTMLSAETIGGLAIDAARHRSLVVIDEAYFPFSAMTVIGLIANHPNLVVLRTFSKAGGLAGLRVGFVAAHPRVIDDLFKVRSPFDVNAFALTCARLLVEHPEVVQEYVSAVRAGAVLLAAECRRLGLDPVPSDTNFMLIRVTQRCSPARLVEEVRARGFLIRGPFSIPCLRECVRVTVGPEEIMRRFVASLSEALAAAHDGEVK